MTDSVDQRGSNYIVSYQLCSMIQWSILNASFSKSSSGVFNPVSWVIQCCSGGEECVLQVLLAICNVGRQGDYTFALAGIFSIQWHHVGFNSGRQQFLWLHVTALTCQMNTYVHYTDNYKYALQSYLTQLSCL
jgi:hypothetical protein